MGVLRLLFYFDLCGRALAGCLPTRPLQRQAERVNARLFLWQPLAKQRDVCQTAPND